MNGHSNGYHKAVNGHAAMNGNGCVANGSSGGGGKAFTWSVGFVNSDGKYLTAESFGFKVNATGNTLKKRQVWQLEQARGDVVYLRSYQGRYVSSDKHGNVMGDSQEQIPEARFVVEMAPGDGRWALRSEAYGYYLGGRGDNLKCFAKTVDSSCLWSVHLAVHPQVHLKNANRKRYARLGVGDGEELQCVDNMPWGKQALITIEYLQGKYAIRMWNGKYLHRDGQTVPDCSPDTLFTLEFHSGYMAFKDSGGRYLTAVGPNAVVRSRNTTVTRDEMFSVEDSQLQASFVAHNGRVVSVKQGVDVSANQEMDEVSDTEIFQIEQDRASGRWLIRTSGDKYWTLETASGIQAKPLGNNATKPPQLFELVWQEHGHVAFRADNGRFVTAKMNGHLYATMDEIGPKEKFEFHIMNRPILVLKGEFGFVGAKSSASSKIECNKSTYDTVFVEQNSRGAYYFKDASGQYWRVTEEGFVQADGAQPHAFFVELRDQSKLALKSDSGHYISGEQSGIFRANQLDVNQATLWEF